VLQVGGSTSSHQISSGGGTYYKGSGTYVDSSGSGMSIAPEYVPSDATIDSGEDPNIPSGSGRQSGRSSGGTTIGGGGIQSIGTPLQQLGITTKKAKTKKAKTISPSTKTTTQQISAHQIDVAPDKFDVRGYQKSDMSTKQKLGYAFGKYTSLDTYRNIGADFFGAGKKQGAFNIGGLFTPLAIFNKPKGDIEIKADPYGQGTQIGYGMSDEQTARVTPTYLKDKTGFERLQEKITINPDLAKPQEQIIYEESVGLSKDIEKDIKKTYQDK